MLLSAFSLLRDYKDSGKKLLLYCFLHECSLTNLKGQFRFLPPLWHLLLHTSVVHPPSLTSQLLPWEQMLYRDCSSPNEWTWKNTLLSGDSELKKCWRIYNNVHVWYWLPLLSNWWHYFVSVSLRLRLLVCKWTYSTEGSCCEVIQNTLTPCCTK